MTLARMPDSSGLPVSLVGRLAADPELQVADQTEVSVLHLAVLRCPDDCSRGTLPVEALMSGAGARAVAQSLGAGCHVWVSGSLDVGLTPSR